MRLRFTKMHGAGNDYVYIDAFLAAKGALSPDGAFPDKGADTAFRALASIDAELAKANGAEVTLEESTADRTTLRVTIPCRTS